MFSKFYSIARKKKFRTLAGKGFKAPKIEKGYLSTKWVCFKYFLARKWTEHQEYLFGKILGIIKIAMSTNVFFYFSYSRSWIVFFLLFVRFNVNMNVNLNRFVPKMPKLPKMPKMPKLPKMPKMPNLPKRRAKRSLSREFMFMPFLFSWGKFYHSSTFSLSLGLYW